MILRTNVKTLVLVLIFCSSACCAEGPNTCFVCDGPVDETRTHVIYRGLLYLTHTESCLREWEQAVRDDQLDAMVFKVEPRGALFQGDSKFLNPTFQKAHPISNKWMWLCIGILVAIVSGGFSAALAIASHYSGLLAFVVGFLLPGFGILIFVLLSGRRAGFKLRGTKIATTFDVVNCPECNYPGHPAAAGCISCGASLTPKVESEVLKMRK
ncbi:MAG: hypothetical protein GY941_11345 [Planctomycetes bacterium]|nr:hypothetical protein [Planctomycetota bacterium]